MLNSEIGYITFFEQGHPDGRQYILNGNIVPHYYVFPRHWKVNFVLTPQVIVRIIANQNSLPVRTPSFIPGGNFYFNISQDRDSVRYKYMNVGAFHHSNGQDGPPLNSDGSINLYNGNFSTNYLVIGLNWGRNANNRNDYKKIELELHSGLLKIGDEPAYRDRFGKARINFHLARSINGYVKRKNLDEFLGVKKFYTYKQRTSSKARHPSEEHTRLVIDGTIVLDNIRATWNQHFNIEFKYYVKFQGSENTSAFLSFGYRGVDKYNVYFCEPYPYIGVGIAASNSFFYNKR